MSRRKTNKPKFKFQTLRGFKDNLPEHQNFWDFVLKNIQSISEDYSYQKIDTPILENFSLFQKAFGKDSEIVLKEIFTFEDKEGEKVALRPGFTSPIARAYIEHGMISWPQPVKLWSFGPVFQYHKTKSNGSGNYKQFHLFNFEIIGSNNPDIDSQIIIMASELYKTIGIEIEAQINSLGCSKCQKDYTKILKKYLHDKKICSKCKENVVKKPLRVLDCQDEKCKKNLEQAPQIIDNLCEDCKKQFVKILENLDDAGVSYNLNPFLVGDAEYYNRTVFKIYTKDEQVNNQMLLGSGGRYDYLIEQIGGKPTPAISFSGMVEKVILKIRENGIKIKNEVQGDVFIAQLGQDAKKKCIKLFKDLRQENIKVKEAFSKKGLTDQLEIANKMKVRYALILGQKEIIDDTIIIRDMNSGIQELVPFTKTIPEIKKRLLGDGGIKIYNNKEDK